MVDILLDRKSGDIDLSNNTIRLTDTVQDNTYQRVLITLNTNKGEWLFNVNYAVPYLKNKYNPIQLLGKTSQRMIDAAIKEAVLGREGVKSITDYSSEIDKQTRIATVSFKAITEDGEIIPITTELNL